VPWPDSVVVRRSEPRPLRPIEILPACWQPDRLAGSEVPRKAVGIPLEHKDLVRRYFAAIDERRDSSVIHDFVSPDFVDHSPAPGFSSDIEGLVGAFDHFLEATPDGMHEIVDMLADGDRVATRIRAWGTHKADLFGMAPTDKKFEIEGIVIHRIAAGKIVERWNVLDMMGALVQLGFVEPPGEGAA
jgi:predicted ester cyclase